MNLLMAGERECAKRYHLDFMRACWIEQDPFLAGRHTIEICKTLDSAIKEYRAGGSPCIILTCPPRHGKSEIISRMFVPRFLGLFPEKEVLAITHTAGLSNELSRFARDNVMKSEVYQEIFPNSKLSKESSSVEQWTLSNGLGKAQWAGIGKGISGKGYSLGVIDDYCPSQEEALSQLFRDKSWEWFGSSFINRRAPHSITIILATRWHEDDLIGRILNHTNPAHADYDPKFPKFTLLKFPAKNEDGSWLWPERFSPEMYESNITVAGRYAASALYFCEPIARGGNLFLIEKIQVLDKCPDNVVYCRAWDLASTEDERNKNDPDYTVGALVAVEKTRNQSGVVIEKIYVKDIKRIRGQAPERDRTIKFTADIDGQGVAIGLEGVGGYLDTYNNIKEFFKGKRKVVLLETDKDKIVRAQPVEPIIESGNMFLERGEWNRAFIEEMGSFPNGRHDDQVDAVVYGYMMGHKAKDYSSLAMMTAKGKNDELD